MRRRCKTVNIIRSSIIHQRGIFGGNAILIILEPPAFKEYSIHWVLEALCILSLSVSVCLCLCICFFVSLCLCHCHYHYLHPGAQRQGYWLKIEKNSRKGQTVNLFIEIRPFFLCNHRRKKHLTILSGTDGVQSLKCSASYLHPWQHTCLGRMWDR